MKFLLLITLFLGLIHAQELTPSQVQETLKYNHKPSQKVQYRRLLQGMAELTKEEAESIAAQKCDASVKQSRLMRHGKHLFYAIKTTKCLIKVDALDGSIMTKKGM